MYRNLKEVTTFAEKMNMTIGSFNTHNLEMLPSILKAAKNIGTPIIIQTSVGTANYIGHSVLVSVVKNFANDEMVDAVLHLDHAKDFDDIKKAIDAGYSSVMFDGSDLPFKDNILKTKAIVEYAHPRNVSVEAEIGTIGGTEEGITVESDAAVLTNPEDAKTFAELTNVDALAVAIGTNHGQYKSKTDCNVPLLKQIHSVVDIPLVIHGGTGVKESEYPNLINNGIRKFNVGTELLVNWNSEAKEQFIETKIDRSIRHNVIPANEAVQKVVENKISLFRNSENM